MNGANATPVTETLPDKAAHPLAWLRLYRRFGWALGLIVLLYAWPLAQLLQLSLDDELYSHVFLLPLASAYLIWLKRFDLPPVSAPDRTTTSVAAVVALLLLLGYAASVLNLHPLALDDTLALSTASFVSAIIAAAAFFLGRSVLWSLAFPFGSLVFMIPMPVSIMTAVESGLQHGSAVTAHWFFNLSGMPVFRDATLFMLPGFSMEVAPECSGIRSSLALFITSTFAGYMFLQNGWNRLFLSLSVVPLALLRNGFRVWVIGELCVNVDPEMIDSFVHKQGGPIFFALSLIPFSGLLYLLVRREKAAAVKP